MWSWPGRALAFSQARVSLPACSVLARFLIARIGETATKACDKFDVKYPATCPCVLKLAEPELLNAHGGLELSSSLFMLELQLNGVRRVVVLR